MELNIKISDSTYKAIQDYQNIAFSEIHELFDAIRDGVPADESLNVKEDKASETNQSQGDVHSKIDDFEKAFCLDYPGSSASEFVEVCRLMTDCLGRNFDPNEVRILCLYNTILQNKDWIKMLEGTNMLQLKSVIRSLMDRLD